MNRLIVGIFFGGVVVCGAALTLLNMFDSDGNSQAVAAAAAPPAAPRQLPYDAERPPRAVTPETDFDFGVMDYCETAEHIFTVRNEGESDLTLELEGTSCKCTLADLNDGSVPPGEERTVRLEWETQDMLSEFRHGAILRTNDPDRPELRFVVTGRVRRKLMREPADLVIIGRALPTERASHGVWFYSQEYAALEVISVESTHPHLSWQVEPVSMRDMQQWQATSALKLRITLEPGQAEGRYGGQLRVQLRVPGLPDDQQPPLEVVDVHSQVLSRVRLFGPKYEVGKLLNLEQLVEGEGTTSTVFLALRGEQTEINILETHCTPEFLQIRFERDESPGAGWARYKIVVTVPEDAPAANYLQPNLGEVRLTTDHPDVPEIRFKVAVAIAPAPKSVYGVAP